MSKGQKQSVDNDDVSFDYEAMNTIKEVLVKRSQLPLSCPMDTAAVWCSHPRVSLPLEAAGKEGLRCSYCGTLYRLQDDE